MQQGGTRELGWSWATLMLSSITVASCVLAVWELLENRFFSDLNYVTLHYLYVTRGIATALLMAIWAAWFVLRERRDKEQRLERMKERYRGIVDTTPDAVVLYDSERNVVEWNRAAEELYGYRREDVAGTRLPTVPPLKEPELSDWLEQAGTGHPVKERETQRRAADGTIIPVQLSLLPFREAGANVYFLEVTHDIRDRIRLRQTLIQVEKLTTMGTMAAGTAHHLNTPLASMALRLKLMRDGIFEGSLEEDLQRMTDALDSCQRFVQQLLRYSRSTPGCRQPEPLGPTLEAVIAFVTPQFLAKGIRLVKNLQGVEATCVMAERTQLEALLLTLLTNACDAVLPGGEVGMVARTSGESQVQIAIIDNGCGIEASLLPHVKEPFFTTKPAGQGTGLGLAIAANIVEEHSGTLEIVSAPAAGTTVTVTLPAHAGAMAAAGGVP